MLHIRSFRFVVGALALAALIAAAPHDARAQASPTAPAATWTPTATPTATASATKTATPTPTATATLTPTATPTAAKPPARRGPREASSDAVAMGAHAPNPYVLTAGTGAVVDGEVRPFRFLNGFHVRGIETSINAAGSVCTLTLTFPLRSGATRTVTFSLVGKATKANYVDLMANPPDIAPGGTVTLKTDVTGVNTGLYVALDIAP